MFSLHDIRCVLLLFLEGYDGLAGLLVHLLLQHC
jgi:hypothetical protein